MKELNVYIIWQNENMGWETFTDAIVSAENENEAKKIHPDGRIYSEDKGGWLDINNEPNPNPDDWTSIENVKVKLIDTKNPGVILSKYKD